MKSQDAKNAEVTLEALESKVPFMLKFLSSEDDDVSGTVAVFAHDYMTLLKQMLPLNEKQRAIVQVKIISVLFVCIYIFMYMGVYYGASQMYCLCHHN